MKKTISILCYSALLCVLFSYNVVAQTFNYLPAEINGHQTLTYTQFTISYNEEHEQADWVAYELTDDEATKHGDRCNCFKKDNNVTTGSATKADYRSTGFDRGHLCPAADNNMSEQANEESFLMSNMSPQIPGFNRGIWKKLESQVRNWAIDNSIIYVVTGPIFKENIGSLGVNKVTIPGFYYKVILDYHGPEIKAIGLILRHQSSKESLESFAVTVDRVEVLTGIDFFADLPDNIEEELESNIDISKWNLKQKNKTYKPSEVKLTTKRKTKQYLKGGTYWITTNSGIRHNPTCRWYENSKGRPGTIKEGRACKVCGG
jgi:endonuclease G, mitochondrial